MFRSILKAGGTLEAAIGLSLLCVLGSLPAHAKDASVLAVLDREEGAGPFGRLIIRGATLIDGTGAPPLGPVDVVVEQDRIVEIRRVGVPGMPIQPSRRPATDGAHEIDAEGMYLLPGLVDVHAHIGFTLAGGESLPPGWVDPVPAIRRER